jgi:hypothetical protein
LSSFPVSRTSVYIRALSLNDAERSKREAKARIETFDSSRQLIVVVIVPHHAPLAKVNTFSYLFALLCSLLPNRLCIVVFIVTHHHLLAKVKEDELEAGLRDALERVDAQPRVEGPEPPFSSACMCISVCKCVSLCKLCKCV